MVMQYFFGDSHSRQFVGVAGGKVAHYVFSGASLKGLASPNSRTGHRNSIIHALSDDSEKNAFLMFGGVDMDVSLYWELDVIKDLSLKSFLAYRTQVYVSFIRYILDNAPKLLSIVILAPQISPLSGEGLYQSISGMTGLNISIIRSISTLRGLDACSRAQLILEFNDRLGPAVVAEGAKFIRIDRDMIDADYQIKTRFKPKDDLEHHASTGATIEIWRPQVLKHIYPSSEGCVS